MVSIGPIHHGKENLKATEDHKIMYLQQFLERSKASVEDLINIIKENETEVRDCYADTINLSRKDFATMILITGCCLHYYGLTEVQLRWRVL